MSGRFSLLWERVLTFRENLAGADGLDLKSPSKPVVTPGPGTTGSGFWGAARLLGGGD